MSKIATSLIIHCPAMYIAEAQTVTDKDFHGIYQPYQTAQSLLENRPKSQVFLLFSWFLLMLGKIISSFSFGKLDAKNLSMPHHYWALSNQDCYSLGQLQAHVEAPDFE